MILVEISATELESHFSEILKRVEDQGEGLIVTRGRREIARILPGPACKTAIEAMSDLYRALPEEAAKGWLEDAQDLRKAGTLDELKDPWES